MSDVVALKRTYRVTWRTLADHSWRGCEFTTHDREAALTLARGLFVAAGVEDSTVRYVEVATRTEPVAASVWTVILPLGDDDEVTS